MFNYTKAMQQQQYYKHLKTIHILLVSSQIDKIAIIIVHNIELIKAELFVISTNNAITQTCVSFLKTSKKLRLPVI